MCIWMKSTPFSPYTLMHTEIVLKKLCARRSVQLRCGPILNLLFAVFAPFEFIYIHIGFNMHAKALNGNVNDTTRLG